MRRFLMPISIVILTACSVPTLSFTQPSPTPTKPQVIIGAPVSGTAFAAGAEVVVQSTATDASGIVRVALLVDGQVVRSDTIPTGKSQPQFQIAQAWKATTPGVRIVVVRATNEAGATGEAAISLTISEPPKPTSTPAPTAAP
ncbi:MAG: Ig-like domain-containing protein, partial [Chloroflexota bacterium]